MGDGDDVGEGVFIEVGKKGKRRVVDRRVEAGRDGARLVPYEDLVAALRNLPDDRKANCVKDAGIRLGSSASCDGVQGVEEDGDGGVDSRPEPSAQEDADLTPYG